MRLANYRDDVLFGIGNELGIDTANDINDEHARAWTGFAEKWLRYAWQYWDWPELAVTEERAFRTIWSPTKQFRRSGLNGPDELFYLPTMSYYAVLVGAPGDPPAGTLPTDTTYFAPVTALDRYINLDQMCRKSIGTMLGVYAGNPRLNGSSPGLLYRPSERGLDLDPIFSGATVFVHYRLKPSKLSAKPYLAGTTYKPPAVVLWIDGQCYRCLITCTNIDPTNINYWAVVPVPETLVNYVVKRAAADAADDAATKAQLISDAEDAITQECNKLMEQGQSFQYSLRTPRKTWYAPFGVGGFWWSVSPPFTASSTTVTTLTEQCEDEGFIEMSTILSQSEGAVSRLINGQDYFDVVFGTPKNTINYDFGQLVIENLVDAGSAEKLSISGVINKTVNGFRVLLSAAPDTDNYMLRWRVGLIG